MKCGEKKRVDRNKDDDVSASFTRESDELYRHEDVEEVLEFGDLNESNTPKPVLNLIRSLLKATFSASNVLFWKPTSNLLWPELSDALRECYQELTPQTLKLYLQILPVSLSKMYNVLVTTPTGQQLLHSISGTQQAALETISTESSQSCVQKGATALVSIVDALHTPQAQQALNSIATLVQSIQQAISTPQAQECVSAFTNMIWNGIETIADEQTTTAIAEVSAMLSLALEQTRLDMNYQRQELSLTPGQPSAIASSALEMAVPHPFLELFQQRYEEKRHKLPLRRKRHPSMPSLGNDDSEEEWVPIADAEEQNNVPIQLHHEQVKTRHGRSRRKHKGRLLKLERYALSAGLLFIILGCIAFVWIFLGCLGIYHLLTKADTAPVDHHTVIKLVYIMPNGQISTSAPPILESNQISEHHSPFDQHSILQASTLRYEPDIVLGVLNQNVLSPKDHLPEDNSEM